MNPNDLVPKGFLKALLASFVLNDFPVLDLVLFVLRMIKQIYATLMMDKRRLPNVLQKKCY